MRLVIDTNVLLPGVLWRGSPHVLLEYVRDGGVDLVTSQVLFNEFADVIARPKFSAMLQRINSTPAQICHELAQLADIIIAPHLSQTVSRDPDDDAVLACAVAGLADLIVTGDDDLLILKTFRKIPIIPAEIALQYLNVGK